MTSRPTVLFVEDNKSLQGLVELWLEFAGFRVLLADDGRQGLDLTARARPDLVVTDAMMPNLSGDEMVASIRSMPELADVPIIVTTAAASQDRIDRMIGLGCHAVLGKPLVEDQFVATCREALEAKGVAAAS